MKDIRSGKFHDAINQHNYSVGATFNLEEHHKCVIVEHRRDSNTAAALRLRTGRVGFASYLNEINVYLLPGFRHENIAPFLGHDKRMFLDVDDKFTSANCSGPRKPGKPLFEDYNSDTSYEELYMIDSSGRRRKKRKREKRQTVMIGPDGRRQRLRKMIDRPIEYWIVNDFSRCIMLRDYLKLYTISWPELMVIARGIANGLVYLHEYNKYLEDFNVKSAEFAYGECSDLNLITLNFGLSQGQNADERRYRLKAAPPDTACIIHRNLTSCNIILRSNFSPMIWNFGVARTIHPMQPINYVEMVDKPHRKLFETSVYSPPEVLYKNAPYTISALRATDIYAAAMIFWELLTRCRLAPILGANDWTNLQRVTPLRYAHPLERELACLEPTYNLLFVNVCLRNVRPTIRPCWMQGHKTRRFVKTMMEMWEKDFGCRIHARTVHERLQAMSLRTTWDRRVHNYWAPPDETPITWNEFDREKLHMRPNFDEIVARSPRQVHHYGPQYEETTNSGSGRLPEEEEEEVIEYLEQVKPESRHDTSDEFDDEPSPPPGGRRGDPRGPSTSYTGPPPPPSPPQPPRDSQPSRRSQYRQQRRTESPPDNRPGKRPRRRLIYRLQPEEGESRRQPEDESFESGPITAREQGESADRPNPDDSFGAASLGEFQNISLEDVIETQAELTPIKQQVTIDQAPECKPSSSNSRQQLCETPPKFTKRFTRHLHLLKFKNLARSLLLEMKQS